MSLRPIANYSKPEMLTYYRGRLSRERAELHRHTPVSSKQTHLTIHRFTKSIAEVLPRITPFKLVVHSRPGLLEEMYNTSWEKCRLGVAWKETQLNVSEPLRGCPS